ncbi:Pro-rich N-terminal domain-containing protein [Streptomyces sp. NPDC058287]|uniref:Pro-rich N-terminal domain-containing protein n=1 Tax=unclassified Streptomyces TaxID=2593676 RepID=UPI0036E44B6A
MQHAVGSPLPPPPQSGHGPAAGWSQAAHHPGAHPGPGPAGPPPPAPGFAGPPGPSGPAPHAPAPHAPAPAPHQPAPHPQAPHSPPPQGQPPHPGVPQHAPQQSPQPPSRDTTGHVQLPPGGPVAMPSPPPAAGTADATATTLAVLLIGPAGAGKTSVAKYWAEQRRVPTAHISLDDVREWVRSGFADPQSGWNDHSEAQYRLARRTCGFAARNFLANGISCILDDAVFPDRPVVGLGGWKRHVGPGLLPVVLLPGLEIVLERNAERSGNRRLTDEEVARIHGRMAGWYGSGLPIIDNSQMDVPTTARVLDDVLARSIASPPQW